MKISYNASYDSQIKNINIETITIMKNLSEKIDMLGVAMRVLTDAVKEGYYTSDDLICINYSEITEWLGWPDFQDGGIYEKIIDLAADAILLLRYEIEVER